MADARLQGVSATCTVGPIMHLISSKNLLTARLLLLVLFAFACSACEKRPTVVTLTSATNPPTFKLSGNGNLWEVTVTGFPTLNELQNQTGKYVAIWEIYSNTKESSHTPAEKLAPFTYGTVPSGFKQMHPDGAPPPLEEGKFYEFSANTTHGESDGRGGWKFYDNKFCFTISKGLAEPVPCEQKK